MKGEGSNKGKRRSCSNDYRNATGQPLKEELAELTRCDREKRNYEAPQDAGRATTEVRRQNEVLLIKVPRAEKWLAFGPR
jgi:hypothetical protein